jgi:hypothetical protein
MTNIAELRTRLLATKTQHRVRHMFGAVSVHDESETREAPINPDGQEAADAIDALLDRIEQMEGALAEACDLIESAEKDTNWISAPWMEPSAVIRLRAALTDNAGSKGRMGNG